MKIPIHFVLFFLFFWYNQIMRLRTKNILFNILHSLLALLIMFLAFSSVVFFALNICYNSTYVYGRSMQPTLNKNIKSIDERGDFVLISKFKDCEAGDIVIATPSWSEKTVIKRLIGKPGDTIRIEKSDVFELYCNDKLLYTKRIVATTNNYYTKYVNGLNRLGITEITLGEDEYFIMGDNWADSSDSITNDIKTVSSSQLHGKVDLVVDKQHSRFFSVLGFAIKQMFSFD